MIYQKAIGLTGITSIMILFMSASSVAQTPQDGFFVTGAWSYYNLEVDGDDQINTEQVTLGGGYFVRDNWALGLYLRYMAEDDGDISEMIYQPFVRYFFARFGDDFNMFAEGAFGFGSLEESGRFEADDIRQLDGALGLQYMASGNLALEVYMNVIRRKTYTMEFESDFIDDQDVVEFDFNLDLRRLGLAVTYHF